MKSFSSRARSLPVIMALVAPWRISDTSALASGKMRQEAMHAVAATLLASESRRRAAVPARRTRSSCARKARRRIQQVEVGSEGGIKNMGGRVALVFFFLLLLYSVLRSIGLWTRTRTP